MSEEAIVPEARGDVVGLVNVDAQEEAAQCGEPGRAQPKHLELLLGEGAKVDGIGHVEIVVSQKLLGVVSDADPNEFDVAVGEEGGEGAWDKGRVEDLKDEAVVVDAELEGGDGVGLLTVGLGVGPPLNVQAHDLEVVVGVAGVGGEPDTDLAGRSGYEGLDGVGAHFHFVAFVVVVADAVFSYQCCCHRHCCGIERKRERERGF